MSHGSPFAGDHGLRDKEQIYDYPFIGNDTRSETHLWGLDARMITQLSASSFKHRFTVSAVKPGELRHR